ncbi:hypothetical protein EON80_14635, partial [bacterium]
MKLPLISTLCLPLVLAVIARSDETELLREIAPKNAIWLESLNLSLAQSKLGIPRPGRSYYGQPIKLGETIYPHGVGVGGESEINIILNGSATQFQAQVGVDDEVKKGGNVAFTVLVDDRVAFESGEMHGGDPSKFVQVDLTGAKMLVLRIDNLGTVDYGNNSDWAGAFLRLKPGTKIVPRVKATPMTVSFPTLLPSDPKPAIHGPKTLGLSPKKPFLYKVPTTGTAPLTFAATGLPAGLKIDTKTGTITGRVEAAGNYTLKVTASNAKGQAEQKINLVCAPGGLALTPPMGWNAYELFGESTSDAKVRQAALQLVKSGLAAHGYRTMLVGDAWQGKRDEKGNLLPNNRFPNMKDLGDYLHSLGLQFGLHSSANEHTATGAPGSLGFETQDAQQFAAWGVDYLTYEWSPKAEDTKPMPPLEDKEKVTAAMEKAFSAMKQALLKTDRDIVFSVSLPSLDTLPYGQRPELAPLAKKVGAQMWSERNGMYDNWRVMSNLANLKINTWTPYEYIYVDVPRPAPVPGQAGMLPQAGIATSGVAAGSVATAGVATAMRRALVGPAGAAPAAGSVPATTPAKTDTPKTSATEPKVAESPTKLAPTTITPKTGTANIAGLATALSNMATARGATSSSTAPAGTADGAAAPMVMQKMLTSKPVPEAATGPGFWTYSGPLMMGRMGFPEPRLSRLTPGEQMYQMSVWSLMSAPLILRSDLGRLDPNLLAPTTTAVLTNDEVLEINQDALVKAPIIISSMYPTMVRAKPLADGRVAVGMFNSSDQPRNMRVAWKPLSLEGTQ